MNSNSIVPFESIERKILFIRGKKVMLDKDLAELYEVETKVLNQAVRRNIQRFPDDFMFQLTKEEENCLRSQIVTLNNKGRGQHRKYLPYVFTEQGIAMLSSVLKSEKAIIVNIEIMRTFVKLHGFALSYKDLQDKISKLEEKYDEQFQIVFEALRKMIGNQNEKEKEKIGFRSGKKNE